MKNGLNRGKKSSSTRLELAMEKGESVGEDLLLLCLPWENLLNFFFLNSMNSLK